MRYNELHKLLKKYGCYPTGKQTAGHPEWYSPISGLYFTTSNHLSDEVKKGTLKAILKESGVK
jgi:predicted RNA binding protein YcfA (HicA-like mRNA interferase family)